MKLKILAKNGQKFTQWNNVLLGYNTVAQYTIGMYGCLITSLGNYIGKTPLEVNQILKDNGGFTPGSGNFIWSKCTALGLNQYYASPYYSDPVTSQGITKMKALLDEGRPLLTHVDFDPKDPDDDQHWLLVYGYDEPEIFYAFDPWSGLDITLDVYGGVKRAVMEFKAYDKKLILDGADDALSACMADRAKFWQERDEWKAKYEEGVKQYNELNGKLTIVTGEKENLQKQLDLELKSFSSLQTTTALQITGLSEQVNNLTVQAEKLKVENLQLTEAIAKSDNELQQELNQEQIKIEGLNKKIEELMVKINNAPKFTVVMKNKTLKMALIKYTQL